MAGVLKCKDCREDKQKCQPARYQWPFQRCQRCERDERTCSEPELPPKTRKTFQVKYHAPEAVRLQIRPLAACPRKDMEVNSGINPLLSAVPDSSVLKMRQILSREQVQEIDLLISMKRLTSTTLDQILPLAQDLAKIATYTAPLENNYSTSLNKISDQFCDFYNAIEWKLQTWFHGGFVLDEPNANTMYGQSVSGTLDETKLDTIRQEIHLLQYAGRHGSAYFLKYHHMRYFPQQFTSQDREHLDVITKDYMILMNGKMSRQTLSTNAPMSFWSFVRSPLLPHMFLRNSCTKFARGEKRTDCLGRSISHVLHDYSVDGSKAAWREEDLHHVDIFGRTAMFYACRQGNLKFIDRLYHAGVDPFIPLVTGMYPLHVAATLGYTSICERICDKDSQPRRGVENLLDCMNRTPIMCAANADKHETVDSFFGKGLIPKNRNQFDSIFVDMASKGHAKTVKVLVRYVERMLEHGSAFDMEVLRSAYWHAASRKRFDIMAALSSVTNFDHNKKDEVGRTALARAVAQGDAEYVRFLLDLNSARDLVRIDKNGYTDTSRWTVDPNVSDDEGKSPLILATETGMKECMKLLLAPRFLPVIRRGDLMRARSIARAAGDQELGNILDRAILHHIIERPPDEEPIWPQEQLERRQFRVDDDRIR